MKIPLDMFQLDFVKYVGRKFFWIYSRLLWAYLTYKKNIATLSLYISPKTLSSTGKRLISHKKRLFFWLMRLKIGLRPCKSYLQKTPPGK